MCAYTHVNLCSFMYFEMFVSVRTQCKVGTFQDQGEQSNLPGLVISGPHQNSFQVADYKLHSVPGSNHTVSNTVFIV